MVGVGHSLEAGAAQGLVLDWPEAAAAGARRAGGKGWNLGRLARYGLPVPPGIVIDAAGYRLFLEAGGFSAQARELEAAPLEPTDQRFAEQLAAFQRDLTAAPLPAVLTGALRAILARPGMDAAGLAVRSSATAEDGAQASFAGMHLTSLNVPPTAAALADAVRQCYASLWTAHAVTYRRRLGLSGAVEMAVVIMPLVPARTAGVVFTADPRSGRRDRVVVTANFGLGESVVGGAVDPDEFHVEISIAAPPTIVRRHHGRKERRTVPQDGGGAVLVGASAMQRAASRVDGAVTLNDQQLVDLALLALRCQDALGRDYAPQDVEWAHDGERFWMLQSRPITSLPQPVPPRLAALVDAARPTIWSTANVKEVLPPVLTPYGWSAVRLSIHPMMGRMFAAGGYEVPAGLDWIRVSQGHPMFNLSLMQAMAFDSFGTTPERFNRLIGGHQPAIELKQRSPFTGREGLGRLRRLMAQMNDSRLGVTEVPLASQRMERRCREWLARDLRGLSAAALMDLLLDMGREYAVFAPQFMRGNSIASLWVDTLPALLETALPGRGRSLAPRLLVGGGDVASAEQGYRLVEMARLASSDQRARHFFLHARCLPPPDLGASPSALDRSGESASALTAPSGSTGVSTGVPSASPGLDGEPSQVPDSPLAAHWEWHLAGSAAGDAFGRLLHDFGHRGVDELEIANPRWTEDPSYLVETIRSYIIAGQDGGRDAAAQTRAQAEAELRQVLRFHPLRPIVRWVLSQARRTAALRENTKSVLVLSMLPTRRVLLEIGRRLVEQGWLERQEDVFFLMAFDLMAYLSGVWDGQGAAALAADRRAVYRSQVQTRVADVMLDDRPHVVAAAAGSTRVVPGSGDTVYLGLGVAAGVARGPARVIHSPREGAQLQRGEVLVAPATDPGWTPLFLRAAGLVMETGGFLSHGAIVAREYGIPAVANIPGVLDLFHNGDTLTVDGDQGQLIAHKSDR